MPVSLCRVKIGDCRRKKYVEDSERAREDGWACEVGERLKGLAKDDRCNMLLSRQNPFVSAVVESGAGTVQVLQRSSIFCL